jgi:hypothetical protein
LLSTSCGLWHFKEKSNYLLELDATSKQFRGSSLRLAITRVNLCLVDKDILIIKKDLDFLCLINQAKIKQSLSKIKHIRNNFKSKNYSNIRNKSYKNSSNAKNNSYNRISSNPIHNINQHVSIAT